MVAQGQLWTKVGCMAQSILPQHLLEFEFEYENVIAIGIKKAMNKQWWILEMCIHIIKLINYFNNPVFVDLDGGSKKEQSVKQCIETQTAWAKGDQSNWKKENTGN